MKTFNLLLMAALLLTSTPLFAQDADWSANLPAANLPTTKATEPEKAAAEVEEEKPSFELSGMVDAYYQAGLIKAEDKSALGFPTSFTDQVDQFAIGQVSLLATKEMGKVSFTGQVGFGPRAVGANSDSNGDVFLGVGDNLASTIQQLFVTYAPSDWLTFTMGNFGTFVGYEVIDAAANVNYSTSYLFSNGPFYHTGLKADVALGEKFGAMLGVFNDTDSKFDLISGKHYGGQLSAEAGGLSAYLNFITGKEEEGEDSESTKDDLFETQVDLTAVYEVSESFALGLNASQYSTSIDGRSAGGFFGTALYSTIGFSESFNLGLRAEMFNLTAAEGDNTDQPNVFSFTASGNFHIDDLRIIPEFRFDTGSNGFLFGESVEDKSVFNFILAAVYSF